MRGSTTMMTLPRASKRRAAVTDPMEYRPTLARGTHRIISPIAMGGMSGVYLAEDQAGSRFALKVLDPKWSTKAEVISRFAAEHEVSRRVGHPGLVRILQYVRTKEQPPYLVMELIDGENLGATIDRSGPLLPGAVAAVGAQLADALHALHLASIVHCDVKPDNVMILYAAGLGGWPKVKLGDFGVAKFLDQLDDDDVAGTPSYMAPEQWSGEVETRTDIYGLGCTLYELATGRLPFDGSVPELAEAHANVLPERPVRLRSSIPVALDRLIMRMLNKEPAARGNAGELARELGELAMAQPPTAAGIDILSQVA